MTAPYRRAVGSDEALADLFADVLGVERVGLDDDFFDLGGDSLAVVKLVSAIHERFGLDVDASMLIDAPTVARLSRRLGRRRPRDAALVTALSGPDVGTGPPFFCVAGGGAPAVQLHAIADAMATRPFYGVQARGLEERARPDRSVPRFARRVLSEIRAIQPHGPYLLGGHSFGCIVAFQMACQLLDEGEQVELLVLFDTPVPPWRSSQEVRRLLSPNASTNAVSMTVRARRAGARRYRFIRRTLWLATAGIVPRRGLRQYDLFYVLSLEIGRKYNPGRSFAGPTLVVRAAVIEYFADPDKELPDLGWSRLITGSLTAVTVPGDHLTVIRRPHVAAVAAAIEETLAATR